MNKATLIILWAAVASLLPSTAGAYDLMHDGIYYDLVDDHAVVTHDGNSNCYSGEVVIPPTVSNADKTYPVIAIGQKAFYQCVNMTHVTMPNTITTIDNYAFGGCTSLTSMTIPESVTTIGQNAFAGCTGIKTVVYNAVQCKTPQWESIFRNSPLETLVFGQHVQVIPNFVANGQTHLKSVTLPNSVTTISNDAFRGCTGLSELTLPESLITIGGGAFSGCSGLTSIVIPDGMTTIGGNAFSNCTGIERLVIGNSVTSIGESAFSNCSGMKSLTIGNSVTTIGDYAFRACRSLTNITLPNSVTTIGQYVFDNCSQLASVTFGSGVSVIDSYIFDSCSQISNVYCLAITPPTFSYSDLFRDKENYDHAELHVLQESLRAYKTAYSWKEFYRILGDVILYVPGDVNEDGEVDIADANSVTEIIINGNSSGGHTRVPQGDGEVDLADVNGDGEVNIADFNAVIDAILHGK